MIVDETDLEQALSAIDRLSSDELIEATLDDAAATPRELALAERLQSAIDELERLTVARSVALGLPRSEALH